MKAGDRRLSAILLVGGFLEGWVWLAVYWQVLDLSTYPPKWVVVSPFSVGVIIMWICVVNFAKSPGFKSRTTLSMLTFVFILLAVLFMSLLLVAWWSSFAYL